MAEALRAELNNDLGQATKAENCGTCRIRPTFRTMCFKIRSTYRLLLLGTFPTVRV